MNSPRLNTRPAIRRRRSWRPSLEEVERRQLLSSVPLSLYVLGSNGNLWQEAPGWQTTGRTLVDSNVKAFVPTSGDDLYVEETDGSLWLEGPNWQTTGRTFIDSSVEAFSAVAPGDQFAPAGAGDLYVEGTDGNLWLEGPGWETIPNGRTLIATDVQSFAADPNASGYLYVQQTNGNLWLEAPGSQAISPDWVDSNVEAFVAYPNASGDVYVEGTDGNLWREAPGWAANGRTPVDSNVKAFAAYPNASGVLYVLENNGNLWLVEPGPPTISYSLLDSNVQAFVAYPNASGDVYVEGTDGILWLEAPDWQTTGRTLVEASVSSFAADPYSPGVLYVEQADGALWQEAPGSQTNGPTWIDSNVAAFAGEGPLDPTAASKYSPAAPAGAPLFNNGEPSYLDVRQGDLADCWLLASLAEVADRDPQDIQSMFTYDSTTVDNGATVGLYTVRFFTTSGSAIYVQVDTDLPSGGVNYANVANALGTQALWVALAEKAYAEANSLGCVITGNEYQDSYGALNYGNLAWSLQAITGNFATGYSINPTNIATAWNLGCLVVLYHRYAVQFLHRRRPLLCRRRLQRVERRILSRYSTRGAPTLRGGPPAAPGQSMACSRRTQHSSQQTSMGRPTAKAARSM